MKKGSTFLGWMGQIILLQIGSKTVELMPGSCLEPQDVREKTMSSTHIRVWSSVGLKQMAS